MSDVADDAEVPQRLAIECRTVDLGNGYWGWELDLSGHSGDDEKVKTTLESGPEFGTEYHAARALRALLRVLVNMPKSMASTTTQGWHPGSRGIGFTGIPILSEPTQGD